MAKKKDTEPDPEKHEGATAPVAAPAPLAGDVPPGPDAAANAPVGNAQQAIDDAETRSQRAFFGRSAQLAVMAELLYRRINVAIPEVDVGDDIFVVKGLSPQVTRVQVKGARAKEQKDSHFVLINVPSDQLKVPQDNPPLVYAFPIRRWNDESGRWSDFLVIRRGILFARFNEGAGTEHVDPKGKPYVQFRIVLTANSVRSGTGDVDLQKYRNAWDPWPPPLLDEENPPAEP
jgi:hypothetical protein